MYFVGVTMHKFFIIALCSFSLLFAEGLVGHWQDTNANVHIKIYANGTYEILQPYQGTGQCGIQGNVFMMRDYNSNAAFSYVIQSVTQNQVVLYDPNNNSYINLSRVIERQQVPTLATSGQYQLTNQHVAVGITLVEFIVGQQITSSEKLQLQQAAIEEFKEGPKIFLQQIQQVYLSLQQIQRMTNPLDIGITRQTLITEIYKETRYMKANAKPKVAQVIENYVKVVAYDEKANLAATDRDIEAFFHYLAFIHYLNGTQLQISEQTKKLCSNSLSVILRYYQNNKNRYCAVLRSFGS